MTRPVSRRSDIVPVAKEDAASALRASAYTEVLDEGDAREPRTLVHSFAHSTGIAIGADADLASVLEEVDAADELAWIRHPLGHDLAVRVGDRVRYYDVRRPK